MKLRFTIPILILIFSVASRAQDYKIIESTSDHIKLEFNFDAYYTVKDTAINGRQFNFIGGKNICFKNPGEPWLPDFSVNIGIPFNSAPQLKILNSSTTDYSNIFIIPLPDSLNEPFGMIEFDRRTYGTNAMFPAQPAELLSAFVMRYARMITLNVSPFQFNPVTRKLVFNKTITVEVDFNRGMQKAVPFKSISDKMTDEFISSNVINPKEALSFAGQPVSVNKTLSSGSYWYDPHRVYFKIYVKTKGVYRITYDRLIASGVSQTGGVRQSNLELFNQGKRVPIDLVDVNQDSQFDSGDYFQFVGYPPPSSPNCYFNIYNTENVYWFTYNADSSDAYKYIDGNPKSFNNALTSNMNTLHFEKDLDYERLGYAPDGNRDYWFWDKAEADNGSPSYTFEYDFDQLDPNINTSLPDATIRVNLQGITTTACSPSHNAFVNLNGQNLGYVKWDNEEDTTFTKSFKFGYYTNSPDSIRLFWSGNKLNIGVDGKICSSPGNDIIRINWFEFDYWRWNRVQSNNYIFTSPPNATGGNLYYLWQWQGNNMKIYIPSRGEVIADPLIRSDADRSVLFTDTVSQRTEYFCVSDNSYLTPDSIVKDQPSDLRNTANGADYIIITHPDFQSEAQRLADFRSSHLPGFSSPRVKIVDVNDIYDEFSYGLLDPYALKYFVKYAFDNWQKPAPSFVVLLGDMSYDYRHIYASSLPDFIPSIPYQSPEFGQAASDNEIVAVSGDDIYPDLAIGRLSADTPAEADVLVNKILNYPADNSKAWKKNVLLMASGLDSSDEMQYGFNDQSMVLQNEYLNSNGIDATKIFRYPDKPEYYQYKGAGPEIRQGFDNGAVLANYYGHGGGGQWDLTFTNDDIYQLENGNKLPLVLSVTCYTAHFDNQEIFGEIFNKIPGKGSIGFFGSSGLTWWPAGTYLNNFLFDQIFNKRNYVFGLAEMNAKANIPLVSLYPSQIELQTLLGDPALELALPKYPDFAVTSSDISISPSNPVKGDTVAVKVLVKNYGTTFPGQTATVQLYQSIGSSTTFVNSAKLQNFGDEDSVLINWIPQQSGLIQLTAKVNEVDTLQELDHSDNTASAAFAVYDFGEPNILKPINGYFTEDTKINFVISDIGTYVNKNFSYKIQIDTVENVNSNSMISSPVLSPSNGEVTWQSPVLSKGIYFWKALVFDNSDTNMSGVRTFSVGDQAGFGYNSQGRQLNLFKSVNMTYSDSAGGLMLPLQLIPPKPEDWSFIDSVRIKLPQDDNGITAFTTDGTYFYFGNLPYYTGYPMKIYKIGTGFNGSVKGQNYGAIPNLKVNAQNSIFCFGDGYLYAADGYGNSLLKIDPNSGDTSRVYIPAGLLPSNDGLLKNGGYYLTSDGKYVYNLSAGYGAHPQTYVLRTFDPRNGWTQVGSDEVFSGSSDPGFSGFFVVLGRLYTYESYNSGYFRGYSLSTGQFEDQWLSATTFKNYYTWCYDWVNNFEWASTFRPGGYPYIPGFNKFKGIYKNASGSTMSQEIGPASSWKNLTYDVDASGSKGTYNVTLLGRGITSSVWDTLRTGLQPSTTLTSLDGSKYNYLELAFNFTDSSTTSSLPMTLKSIHSDFTSLPELSIPRNEFSLEPDSLMQGLPVNLNFKIFNLGYTADDSASVNLYINSSDSAMYTKYFSIQPDSAVSFVTSINTTELPSSNNIKAVVISRLPEFYTYNNILNKSFFISRDTTRPQLTVTFDGRQIMNGDMITPKPTILITLQDNSPLPLDTTDFSIVLDNSLVSFSNPDFKYSYTPYPDSKMTITWKPAFSDGRHVLSIMAKDEAGNFADTTNGKFEFYVDSQADIKNVYNYPNPFGGSTYFTFELTGVKPPDELKIRIFTVAGRLIDEIQVPPSELSLGFNRVYWDGRDKDGDDIANGVYFYKIVYKNNGTEKSVIQKLAKVR